MDQRTTNIKSLKSNVLEALHMVNSNPKWFSVKMSAAMGEMFNGDVKLTWIQHTVLVLFV